MDIQTRKIEFVRDFLKMQNEEALILMGNLLRSSKEDFENEFPLMSEEELNQRIDKSMKDSESGKLTKSSDLITEIQGWK
ncbi:MAG TPA: hypothetical protein VK076_04555 [Candidatus Sphingobacterium stercoripullorum]|nr:hypothetical protein [Candidatus Sphingobacterium stercoripullorum]